MHYEDKFNDRRVYMCARSKPTLSPKAISTKDFIKAIFIRNPQKYD